MQTHSRDRQDLALAVGATRKVLSARAVAIAKHFRDILMVTEKAVPESSSTDMNVQHELCFNRCGSS
jgi:hypothetical protein